MTREEVIKGLEILHANNGCIAPYDSDCKMCPYVRVNGCIDAIIGDALALLKAQEPVEPELDETGVFHCADCKKQPVGYKNFVGDVFRHNLYCPNCGRKVKWE